MYLKFCVSSIFNWIHGKFLFYNVKLSIAQFTKSIYDKFSISLLQFFEFKYKTKKFFWNEFALHFQLLWKLLFCYQRFIWFLKILLPFEKILSCLLSLFYTFFENFLLNCFLLLLLSFVIGSTIIQFNIIIYIEYATKFIDRVKSNKNRSKFIPNTLLIPKTLKDTSIWSIRYYIK